MNVLFFTALARFMFATVRESPRARDFVFLYFLLFSIFFVLSSKSRTELTWSTEPDRVKLLLFFWLENIVVFGFMSCFERFVCSYVGEKVETIYSST